MNDRRSRVLRATQCTLLLGFVLDLTNGYLPGFPEIVCSPPDRLCHNRVGTALDLFGIKKNEEHEPSTHELSPKITKVGEAQDFLDFVAEDDRLVVVKFYASWCKSCQKFGVRFRKLAIEEGDKIDTEGDVSELGRVRFAEVEFNANAKLCQTLGIKRLPSIHMYKGKELLTNFSCAPSKFQMVIDSMNEFVDMSQEELKFRKTLEAGSALVDDVNLGLKENNGAQKPENNTRQANL
eukprot:CAMPEP_0183307788 /NCGR_PEP_ID=MMETSP0160_2-20130417/19353_1 /TAXON_ID=2839 ORGANISM="Odontella Sinensis, Strain Grunow 1884" /NCGR_SAMPLE_ID=MMETSP0160_2 /ASSEMBLY_ACC=CAM_ASM_000250 /LENGTH=236 /DNA_ID=CAMNT_0025471457 /DNA_START=66 /DNA_END=776 /DNA_ORIENTATION=-